MSPQTPTAPHPYQLLEIRLDNIEARRIDGNVPPPQPIPLFAQITSGEPANRQCQGRLAFRLGAADSVALPMYIAFDVVAVVSALPDEPADRFDEFIKTQLLHLLWPYVREAVQALSARLGLSPVVIPTLQAPRPESAPSPAAAPPHDASPAHAPDQSGESPG